jgi:hypothetical protein
MKRAPVMGIREWLYRTRTRYDWDGDGLPNEQDPNAWDADVDNDGIWDGAEVAAGTDPTNPDTDSDGVPDGAEAAAGTDPTNPDTDGDGATDGSELSAGTDPKDPAAVPSPPTPPRPPDETYTTPDGVIRHYKGDPSDPSDDVGVRDKISKSDGSTEVEYGTDVAVGEAAIQDMRSGADREGLPTAGSGDNSGGAESSDGGDSSGGGGDDNVWQRVTTQNPLERLKGKDSFGADIVNRSAAAKAEDGDPENDNTAYYNPKTGETVIGRGNLPEGAEVQDQTSIVGAEEGGEAGEETRTQNPTRQGIFNFDKKKGDGEEDGYEFDKYELPDLDKKGAPPGGERETPGLYEGEGEGEPPSPPDPGKDASLTGARRDMTDYDPDNSPVDKQAWDMMGGGAQPDTSVSGRLGAGSGATTGGGTTPTGGAGGTGGTGGTGTGGGTPLDPSGTGFESIPTGRTPTGGTGGGGGSGGSGGSTGGSSGSGGSGGSSGSSGSGSSGSGGSGSSSGSGGGSTGDEEEDSWDLVDVDGDGVPDAVVDEEGNIHEEDPKKGVSTSEDPTGEKYRPSEEEVAEAMAWQDYVRGGRTPIDPNEHEGEPTGDPVWNVRPDVVNPADDVTSRGGGPPLKSGLPDLDPWIQPTPDAEADPQADGEYLDTPYDEVGQQQAAEQAGQNFADNLAGSSGGNGGSDAPPADEPLATSVVGTPNYGEEEPTEPVAPPPGMSYTTIGQDTLNEMAVNEATETATPGRAVDSPADEPVVKSSEPMPNRGDVGGDPNLLDLTTVAAAKATTTDPSALDEPTGGKLGDTAETIDYAELVGGATDVTRASTTELGDLLGGAGMGDTTSEPEPEPLVMSVEGTLNVAAVDPTPTESEPVMDPIAEPIDLRGGTGDPDPFAQPIEGKQPVEDTTPEETTDDGADAVIRRGDVDLDDLGSFPA